MRFKNALYIGNGVVLYKDRVIVPGSLRKAVLDTLHSAHQGVSAMESRAQAMVFWPGITNDIHRVRNECYDCNKNAPTQPPQPTEHVSPPTAPFQQVFADFFDFAGRHYLVVGDRLSGWSEIYSTRHPQELISLELKASYYAFDHFSGRSVCQRKSPATAVLSSQLTSPNNF